MKKRLRRMINAAGYEITSVATKEATSQRKSEVPSDFESDIAARCREVKPYTMTSYERLYSLCKSVEHVVRNKFDGDIVECGVWRGGSMMAAAKTLIACKQTRTLHLFDTFEGMPPPEDVDVNVQGQTAASLLATEDRGESWNWAYASLEDVEKNITETGYDRKSVRFIQGKVEDTIPRHAPECISVLRLDTDWYESTRHELCHLYPRLSIGGVLIIDDYGWWEGARKAVDEYFSELGEAAPLLCRIDDTGRMAVRIQ